MLRLVHVGDSRPFQWPVDLSAEFEPGMAAQLKVFGNQIVCGVSDGTAPIGIIDEMKKNSFTSTSIDEVVVIQAVAVDNGAGTLVSAMDVRAELKNPNIIASSFTARPIDVELIPRNGVVVVPAGTELNFDADGDGFPDSFHITVSYMHTVSNIPGDDTTQGSGKVTVWVHRVIVQTDQFETNVRYPINSPLFVSESGLFTTRQPSADHPGVGIVTGPPSAIWGSLELVWL